MLFLCLPCSVNVFDVNNPSRKCPSIVNHVSSDQIVSTKCLICCEDSDDKLVVVREKGRLSLTECSKLHGCVGLLEQLNSSLAQIFVHDSCRKRFTDFRQFKSSKADDPEV